jgi:hypothetical protein
MSYGKISMKRLRYERKKGKSFGRDVEMGEKNNLDGC